MRGKNNGVIHEERTRAADYTPTIHDLPQDMRPRERMAYAGAGALSSAELLAIILRVGGRGENVIRMAERVLTQFGGLTGLAQASFDQLCQTHGLGQAKAAQIQAALELGKRIMAAAPEERLQVRAPVDVANLLMLEMGLLEQEQMRTVLLDTKNRIMRISTVYSGSLNTAVVRVGEVFREAVRANSAAVVVVHNHPSGDPTPSPEDVRVTQMMVEAGRLLDIDVLDHLVIGRNRFVSMKERGLGF
ncbi:MAG: DNA repair protein RadC [Caldilineaceae bacterium]